MLRALGSESDALYRRLLEVHPNPAAAAVVEVGVFNGQQCLEAAAAGFSSVFCFEPSPANFNNSAAAIAASPVLLYCLLLNSFTDYYDRVGRSKARAPQAYPQGTFLRAPFEESKLTSCIPSVLSYTLAGY